MDVEGSDRYIYAVKVENILDATIKWTLPPA
jgi:hypothetical protein